MMRRIAFLAAFTLLTIKLVAQNGNATAITIGKTEHIQSKELGEMRKVNIYLPQGYSPDSSTLYPVIYLLDGGLDEDFIHVSGVAQFLSMIVDTMSRCIIVGICNTDRKRDMTYPTSIEKDKKDYPTTGGSARYIAYIEQELQPYIQKHYKVSTSSMLIGQSLGGLLATEILLKKPGLFTDYLIVSPSLWWDHESLLTLAPQLLAAHPDSRRHICIAVGAEGTEMEGDAKRLYDIIKAAGKKNTTLDFLSMPQENHLTILHNAVYKGFEILFGK